MIRFLVNIAIPPACTLKPDFLLNVLLSSVVPNSFCNGIEGAELYM